MVETSRTQYEDKDIHDASVGGSGSVWWGGIVFAEAEKLPYLYL